MVDERVVPTTDWHPEKQEKAMIMLTLSFTLCSLLNHLELLLVLLYSC